METNQNLAIQEKNIKKETKLQNSRAIYENLKKITIGPTIDNKKLDYLALIFEGKS